MVKLTKQTEERHSESRMRQIRKSGSMRGREASDGFSPYSTLVTVYRVTHVLGSHPPRVESSGSGGQVSLGRLMPRTRGRGGQVLRAICMSRFVQAVGSVAAQAIEA